jgi:hypothetical protein
MDKSYVSMEQNVCPVCGKNSDTGTILMDTRMKDRFEHNTVTGWSLCPEHQAQAEEGFVFLIGCDESKSTRLPNGNIRPQDAYRTGEVCAIKKEAAWRIFNCEVGPINFCDSGVIEMLQEMQKLSESGE